MYKQILFLAVAITTIWVGSSRAQHAHQHYYYLIWAANALYNIQVNNVEYTEDEVRSVAIISCNTLDRLLEDKRFEADLEDLYGLSSDFGEQNRRLGQNLQRFIESFVVPETQVMKDAGLSDAAIQGITVPAAFLSDSLNSEINPKAILSNLANLRDEVCGAVEAIEQERNERGFWQRVSRWTMGIGGAAMIAVDVPVSVSSGGLASASFTFGGVLIGAAIAEE